MSGPSRPTVPYEHPDPAKMAAFWRVYNNCRVVEDIYPRLASRFEDAGVRRFAELGGGRGPVSTLLAVGGVQTCVVDLDSHMLAETHRPAVRGDIACLPLADDSLDGAAAINCLYFLDRPLQALDEARRVLRAGGLFVASSPSRWNDPELEGIRPRWGSPSSFDAEDAPSLVAEVFGRVEVDRWRLRAYVLPGRAAIADYLHAFGVPDWESRASEIAAPLTITKAGAQVWASK